METVKLRSIIALILTLTGLQIQLLFKSLVRYYRKNSIIIRTIFTTVTPLRVGVHIIHVK